MYLDIKRSIFGAIPFDNDFSHMLLGLTVLLVTVVVFRRPMGQWPTLAPVALLALAMELTDTLLFGQRAGAAAHDFVAACLVPAVLVVVFRQGWARA